jgi:hypothetical protein
MIGGILGASLDKIVSIWKMSGNFIHSTTRGLSWLSLPHTFPIIALIAGILILILPRLLNYVIAIYLIVIGLIGLNGIYHFIH